MAKLSGFKLRHADVDTTQREGGGALPDGFYRFEVDEAADKPHFDNRSGYKIDIVLEVIEPEEFKGRKMFIDFGVVDPGNEEFEGWAREGLGRFLKAIDFPEDKEFDDTDDLIGATGIAKYGLDRKRSDKQNKRYGKVWAYVYPEDERDWLDKNQLGESERQEEWFPGKQTPVAGARGGREERGASRDRDDRGSRGREREERSSGREDRGADRGGRDDRRDSDRSRDRDRDDRGGRDRDDRGRDSRGAEDDDIPFDGNRSEDSSGDRPKRGGDGSGQPWNRGRR